MQTTVPLDTKARYLDRDKRLVGGYLGLCGVLSRAGKTNVTDYKGHILTPHSRIAPFMGGVHLSVDHHFELGPIGVVNRIRLDERGLECEATLFPQADGIVFERENRILPKLLKWGLLYFSWELFDVKLQPGGELVSAILVGAALTEHPGNPKSRAK